VAEAGYFHRTLPYAAAAVDRLNPRLAAARQLAASGAVTFDGEVAVVRSAEETYHVRSGACTCPWWARHRGERGPCRHALAARLVRDSDQAEVPA
jgi:predicted nucleic acid-binding Zn finger protein